MATQIVGHFNRPYGVAIDEAEGRLLVADSGRRRFKWTAITDVAAGGTFAEHGFVSDQADPLALTDPEALAADPNGNLYVVDTLAGNVKLFRFDGNSYAQAEIFCKDNPHTVDGIEIRFPRDVAVGVDGAVYLLDSGNDRILRADGPGDTSWSVFRTDTSWSNAYGLGIDADGAVYVADTGHHRIVKFDGASKTTFGSWGSREGQFRFPRDVAVDRAGRIFVADTFNHRIEVLSSVGEHMVSLGHAPMIGTLDKIAVDSSDRVFAVDSDNEAVVAFLGDTKPSFDLYTRDYLGDSGAEPSADSFALSSPDILVRHQADIDLGQAERLGLESYAFQEPRFGENNYVYVTVHNRGAQIAPEAFAQLYWYSATGGPVFPEEWHRDGFYAAYSEAAHNTPSNVLALGLLSPDGSATVGPLIWRPPAPENAAGSDGLFRIALRISNPYDSAPVDASTRMARDSNNVAERRALVQRAPFPVGNQNTLLLRVHFPNIAATTSPATIEERTSQLADWIRETSWGEASVNVVTRGPIMAKHDDAYYDGGGNSPLVELAQEALESATTAEPDILDGAGPGQEIERVILVTNASSSKRDWATTGAWPFTMGGRTRYLSVSVQADDNSAALFEHGYAHQLGLVDLLPHEGVTFPRPYADRWDNMAPPINGAHPLVWSKELAGWVSTHRSRIVWIPRPSGGTTWNNDGNSIGLNYQETAVAGQTVALAFGLTRGVTSFSDETAFYFVEARRNTGSAAGADTAVPQTGVLMYYANRQIPQGQGPVILRDHVPGGTLDDAAIPVGGSESPAGTGITVAVQEGSGASDYDIAVEYAPPVSNYDVSIRRGEPPWESPDIWIDNQRDGYDTDKGRQPDNRGNQGIAGEENRVYARVLNSGPATAQDVEVSFQLSQPRNTVGDDTDFVEYRSVFLSPLGAGNRVTPHVEWTPPVGVDPHTCVRVELRRLFDDTNASNDWAQRNFIIDHSAHGSPYTPVDFHFQVRNDSPTARPVYFRVDGVPAEWSWSIRPSKLFLRPGERGSSTLHAQPPDNAPDCTSKELLVSGWTPRGDTLIRLGGTTVNVALQRESSIDVDLTLDECRRGDTREKNCRRLRAHGCTSPAVSGRLITLRYERPDGAFVYHTVRTDADGCYDDFDVVVEGGDWGVEAASVGTCLAPSSATEAKFVPLPPIIRRERPFPDLDGGLNLDRISKNVHGSIRTSTATASATECRTRTLSQSVAFAVRANKGGEGKPMAAFDGAVQIPDLRNFLSGSAGIHSGHFTWSTKVGKVTGTVTGLTNIGTHRTPLLLPAEDSRQPRHWELSLSGVVTTGKYAGARISATLAVNVSGTDVGGSPGSTITGALEGIVERDAYLSAKRRAARVASAGTTATMTTLPCAAGGIPCLSAISKNGRGTITLDQFGYDRCGSVRCRARKAWSRLSVRLTRAARDPRGSLGDGTLRVDRFLEAVTPDQRFGEHGGDFVFRASDGNVVRGEMLGTYGVGTHRISAPGAPRLETANAARHLEGQLIGTVISGPLQGAEVILNYAGNVTTIDARRRMITLALEGWRIKCTQARLGSEPLGPPSRTSTSQPTAVRTSPTAPGRPALTPLPPTIFRPLSSLPKEVVAAYRHAEGGKLSTQAQRALRIADYQFRVLDTNESRTLDQAELIWAYLPGRVRSMKAALSQFGKSMMALLDKDKNGTLTPKDTGPGAWANLRLLDTNGNGAIDHRELENLPALTVRNAIRTRDLDHTGAINLTEFVLWSRQLPTISFAPH